MGAHLVFLAGYLAGLSPAVPGPDLPGGLGGAGSLAGGSCEISEEHPLHLFLQLREPRATRAAEVATLLAAAGAPGASCANGELVVEAPVRALRRLFGDALQVGCVSGAGNSLGSSAFQATLSPPDRVPASLAALVRKARIATDPKLALTLASRPCAELLPP